MLENSEEEQEEQEEIKYKTVYSAYCTLKGSWQERFITMTVVADVAGFIYNSMRTKIGRHDDFHIRNLGIKVSFEEENRILDSTDNTYHYS